MRMVRRRIGCVIWQSREGGVRQRGYIEAHQAAPARIPRSAAVLNRTVWGTA